MTRDEVLALLAQHQAELVAFGLRRLALFGSVARDEASPESDIDVLVDFEGEPTFKRYCGLYDCLEDLCKRFTALDRSIGFQSHVSFRRFSFNNP